MLDCQDKRKAGECAYGFVLADSKVSDTHLQAAAPTARKEVYLRG